MAKRLYVIHEIDDVSSPYLAEMREVFSELFLNLTPTFEDIVHKRQNGKGRTEAQLFAGLVGGRAVGILQIFYRPWRGAVLANVDLVGISGGYRKTGLGNGMMGHAIDSVRQVAQQWSCPAAGGLWLTEPDDGPPDSSAVRRMRMYKHFGAYVRRDIRYRFTGQVEPEGEVILWYPMLPELRKVSTKELAWQLWLFGRLPPEEFVQRYGDVCFVEQPNATGE